ncbi:hypothetical protein BJV82DRAFT_389524 [Fennellomyces sp. T-0311]|nr:hypothetical protein BJV82DRAFT_389524 [Fennellomyces sp. T-0311]
MSWKPGVFQTQIAPEPRDLLWKGLLRHGRRDKLMGRLRQWVVFIAVWSLTIFWLFPVSFILGLTSMESLSQHFGFLNYFMDTSDLVRSFIQNILPMLLVTLFMSVLPWILLAISKQQDFVSYSQLEDAVLGRYYRFAVFNVLIVFLLGTSFLSTMLDALYEPAKMIHLLGKFLPQGANFFLNYILFNSATHAMELVQLGSQLFGHIYYRITAKTPRELAKHTKPWSFPYYYYYPNHILVFVIAVTYAVIQPLILLFALFYFATAVICYRHQFAYAYVRSYESNGRLYRRMAGYTSDGLLIFQLTMTGLLYLKAALSAATAILPLTLFTIWAKVQLNRQFSRRCYRIQCQEQEQKINDGVWKVAYIKAWWRHGRYGPQHFPQHQPHSMPSSPTSSTSTDKHALITGPMQVYPDDAPRDDDVYTYPPLVTPLERRLWLPRNICRHRYNLDDCVSLSLDELRRPLDPPNA